MAVVCMLMGEVCPEARACWLVGGPGLQAAGLVLGEPGESGEREVGRQAGASPC